MNTGQLSKIIRAEFLVDAESYTKVEGLPLFSAELDEVIEARLAARATKANGDRSKR